MVMPSSKALFRFTVVSQVLNLRLAGLPPVVAVSEVARRRHRQLDGTARRVSLRAVYRWLAAYERDGILGLESTPRPRIDSSTVLPVDLLEFFVDQRRLDPDASIPELIKRAREIGKLAGLPRVVRQTCWRAFGRMGISTARRKKRRDRDTRRFAFPHRLEMALSDGKHFRAGVHRLRRVALFFLDDATRYGLHVVVGTSQSTELFLRGLYELVRKYGFLGSLYLDHGPGFIANDTVCVVGNLGSGLIHGEEAYPEGHGKIERFNQRVKAALLRHLDRRPDVDADCRALELRLRHYLSDVYNREPHEALGGGTPFERFHADPRPFRFPESDEWLRQRFLAGVSRLVTADHTISIASVDYELPRGYAGHTVTVYRAVLSGKVLLLDRGRFIELHPVDLVANARARRGGPGEDRTGDVAHALPKSAAELAFERDFGPVVGVDGGYVDPEEE